MHPMLSQKILECYFSGLESGRDTQLIFSTHECNLLNLDLIRADEVWFVEKEKDGASHLTSLAEFKPREDVRKGYLLGRYGAIPLLPKEAMKWWWTENNTIHSLSEGVTEVLFVQTHLSRTSIFQTHNQRQNHGWKIQ